MNVIKYVHPGGVVPATGKSLDWAFVAVLDLENGKIKAHRGYGDQVSCGPSSA